MPTPVEHRLAAIMFTDIVGYTGLMRRDERAAMDMLHTNRRCHKQCVERHGGTYLKEMGDGTLASFATATDAVRCAATLIEELKVHQIGLRIGIHLGEVVFEEGDVFGDGVNIASRLEAMAAPGTVFVSDTLYRTVRSKPGVKGVFVDEVCFKGYEEAIKVYQVFVEASERDSVREGQKYGNLSVAVLPFTNMSPDPDQQYFSDGLSEELINALSRLSQLHVCARTSAFQFRSQEVDVREIGRQLNVGSIVTGSVRKAGNRLRITAQLIDAQSGYHVWSERFDREMDDVFAIQDEITLAIVNSLKVRLLRDEKMRLLSRYTLNQEGYHLYLRANYHLNKRTLQDFRRALAYYQEVISTEPEYALAFSGLAIAHVLLARYGGMSPREAFDQAKAYSDRALMLDPGLHEGYLAIALYEHRYQWRWARAEQAFVKALELNPNMAVTHHQYGWFLATAGRIEEGLAELIRAKELDPLSPIIDTNIGTLHYFNADFPQAESQLSKILTRTPDFVVAHQWLGRCYEATSQFDEAIRHHERSLALLGNDPECIASHGHALALSGDLQGAREALRSMQDLSEEKFVSAYWMALMYQGMGDTEACLDHLQRALEERFDWMTCLHIDPLWKPLSDNARFKDILKKVHEGVGTV